MSCPAVIPTDLLTVSAGIEPGGKCFFSLLQHGIISTMLHVVPELSDKCEVAEVDSNEAIVLKSYKH